MKPAPFLDEKGWERFRRRHNRRAKAEIAAIFLRDKAKPCKIVHNGLAWNVDFLDGDKFQASDGQLIECALRYGWTG